MSTSVVSCSSLVNRIDNLMLKERQRLLRRVRELEKKRDDNQDATQLQLLLQDIECAEQTIIARKAAVPVINCPAELPVSQKQQEIAQAIQAHQVVIIAGETGSGKTTQIPKICLSLGRGIQGVIGHTQPRRLAARAVASRIAEELKCPLGSCVGYKVRFADQVSDLTQIKLMTDGILLAEIQHDRLLMQYDTLIIDEAHERSLNIDFILGYLRQLLPKRPDLKIIITSATIDPQRFSRHFDNAPVIEVSGRTYPVDVRYRPIVEEADDSDRDQFQAICDAVDELSKEGNGDILIFMSGEREIRDTADALAQQNLRHTDILPLYARLSNAEQHKIFQAHSGRRIILATNVAETSLTVPGIHYVIDTGTARISRYSYRTKVQRLPIEPISQASANQRKGRCGRLADGICIRLYSEQDFSSRPSFTDPEIMRTNLASVILQMTALGLGDISEFPFVDTPDKRNIQDGVRLLEELGAISQIKHQHYTLTPSGRQLAQLPLDPRLARMVLAARQYACMSEILIITAALSIQDPRERPAEKQQASDEKHRRFADKESDFLLYLNLWQHLKTQQASLSSSQFRQQCKREYINYLRVREWQDIYSQLRQTAHELGFSLNQQAADYRSIHCAILTGLLSHIGQKDVEKQEFTGARQTRFAIFPGSGLFKKSPKWCVVAELVETSRLWGRIAARIEPEWLEALAGHLIKRSYDEPHWEKKQGAVMAYEKVTLYGLAIINARKIHYHKIDPSMCRELFIRHALIAGEWDNHYSFFNANQQLRAEIEVLEHKSRRCDLLVDDDALFTFYDNKIAQEVVSAQHFDAWWKKISQQNPDLLNFERDMLLKNDHQHVSEERYPDFWHQNNLRLPLTYQFEPGANADGVTVQIPLALLNQVSNQGFEWQIPGLRRDLIIALIKSLPKPIRRNLVPAPNYADAFLDSSVAGEQPLLENMARVFRRMTGIILEPELWQWELVPEYLKITFRITDDQQQLLAEGKDLIALKETLKNKVQETLSDLADEGMEQTGLLEWSFGQLPEYIEQQRGHYQIKAWPALVDEKDSVAIRLFDTQSEQQQSMRGGIRRLLLLAMPSPVKYLHEKLPNKAKLGLYFNPYGSVLDVITDCITCTIDKLMAEQQDSVRSEEKFDQVKDKVRAELNDMVVITAQKVELILSQVFAINKRLKGRIDMTLALALADIKSQLQRLVYRGFVTENGWYRLDDTLRYLKAIERRLEKLPQDPYGDRAKMLKIEQIQQEWQNWLIKLPVPLRTAKDVIEVRWMIEELRVSYFAQQLGTSYPVSEKRILQAMKNFTDQANKVI